MAEDKAGRARVLPIVDLGPETRSVEPELMKAIERVVASGQYILGPNVNAFEREVAEYLGVSYAVGVSSGTDALVLALRAVGLGPGDEVLTTPFTFQAHVEAIIRVGATPVFVDIDPDTFNLSPERVATAVTSASRTILPVHLFGQAADMDPLLAIARSHSLAVIEDCAQSFGGDYKGRHLGSLGTLGCFSFYPTKNLGALGDAGAVVTNDPNLAQALRLLRNHGIAQKYRSEMLGYNARLDELQAAALRVKLKHVDKWNAARREAAHYYSKLLRDCGGIVPPCETSYGTHTYHRYTVRIPDGRREGAAEKLREAGVETQVCYPSAIYRQMPFSAPVFLPETERATQEVLCLPLWAEIPRDTQDRVVSTLRAALGLG